MFQTPDVWMVIKKATLSIAEDDHGVEQRVADVALVLDPFPIELARELGEDVAGHVFTEEGAVRHEVSSISLDPRVPAQRMRATGAIGHEGTDIRQVEVLGLGIAKQEDDKTGKVWFKATFKIRFDLAPKINREWLVRCFGLGMLFTFEAEQLSLDMGDVTRKVVTSRDGLEGLRRLATEDGTSLELTTVEDGREIGMRITSGGTESIDRPAGA